VGLFLLKVDINMKDALMLLLGVLAAKISSIVDFYFGSSSPRVSQSWLNMPLNYPDMPTIKQPKKPYKEEIDIPEPKFK